MKQPPSDTITVLDVAARLGVPTFVLVVILLTFSPRLDRALAIGERVDAELQVVIGRCGFAGEGTPADLFVTKASAYRPSQLGTPGVESRGP